MSFFNTKSLVFYGSTIAAVITLFSITTAYGEANLKASRRIDGRYVLAPTAALPGCLAGKPLVLSVQQSGVYLTGSLLTTDLAEDKLRMASERPALTGQWEHGQLTLQGSTGYLPGCQNQVEIQGRIEQATLKGSLHLASVAETVNFTAPREAPQATSQEHH